MTYLPSNPHTRLACSSVINGRDNISSIEAIPIGRLYNFSLGISSKVTISFSKRLPCVQVTQLLFCTNFLKPLN